ncbi:MAG: Rpn family recombination-promoting nuclease/putative transposase, partial [Bryobacterales bacterium]|nr:Rpn family recombination-promoting nuclease/putative transposase [Bryobacterales bacterium]
MKGNSGTLVSDGDRKQEQNPVSSSGQPEAAVAPKLARLNRDRSSKAVFQCKEPVEHLVRFVLSNMKQGRQWLQRMDFSTLEPLPTETVDAWLQAGYQDIAWRLKVRAAKQAAPEWLRVLILVEFQSKVEYDMALRVLCNAPHNTRRTKPLRGIGGSAVGRLPPS